ncbi:dual specificity protein kinase yak1 [Basidiobolus ranarum]|uniref:Dual specificity protein kinase yak1 n=1 Tax=Basidiobolus ranarum TaxID=34480 RepID=A0ABR2WF80_9FUNG
MVEVGKSGLNFFERYIDGAGNRSYRLKSLEQYSQEYKTNEKPSKQYFSATTLPELIRSYPMPRKSMSKLEVDKEMKNREIFLDFVQGLLNVNPLERWSPHQAKLHPFLSGGKFTGHFVPPTMRDSSYSVSSNNSRDITNHIIPRYAKREKLFQLFHPVLFHLLIKSQEVLFKSRLA